jgi:hypothetical protein
MIPSTRETSFDKITHTLHASFIAPAPTYSYVDDTPPLRIEGSVMSLADLRLDHFDPPSFSPSYIIDGPPPVPTPTDRPSSSNIHPAARPTHALGATTPPTQVPLKTRFKIPFLSESRRQSIDMSHPSSPKQSRKGSLDLNQSRKGSASSMTCIALPEGMQPSLGYVNMPVEVISVPRKVNGADGEGIFPGFQWDGRENVRGLGSLKVTMSSSLVSSYSRHRLMVSLSLAQDSSTILSSLIWHLRLRYTR